MKRFVYLLAVVMLIAGCATPGKFHATNTANRCAGTGKVKIEIKYGDSYIQVTPKANTKRRGEIIYDLKPEQNPQSGINYDAVLVTVNGKTATDVWLNTTGTAAGGDPFICVDQNQAFGNYDFSVTVTGVGTIDPRVEVTN